MMDDNDHNDRDDIFSVFRNMFHFPSMDDRQMGGDFSNHGNPFEEMERHMQDMMSRMGNIFPSHGGIISPSEGSAGFDQRPFGPSLPSSPRDEMLKEPDRLPVEAPKQDTDHNTDSLADACNRVMFPGFSGPQEGRRGTQPFSSPFSQDQGWSSSSTYSWSSSTGDGMNTVKESRTYSTPDGREKVETFTDGGQRRTVITKTDMLGNVTKTESTSPSIQIQELPSNECPGCQPVVPQPPANNTNYTGFFNRLFGFDLFRKKD